MKRKAQTTCFQRPTRSNTLHSQRKKKKETDVFYCSINTFRDVKSCYRAGDFIISHKERGCHLLMMQLQKNAIDYKLNFLFPRTVLPAPSRFPSQSVPESFRRLSDNSAFTCRPPPPPHQTCFLFVAILAIAENCRWRSCGPGQ